MLGRSHLVMGSLDDKSHILQIHDNVTTGIFAEIQGTDVKIPCLLMGVGGRHGIFVRIK